jgi:hypothetical protein
MFQHLLLFDHPSNQFFNHSTVRASFHHQNSKLVQAGKAGREENLPAQLAPTFQKALRPESRALTCKENVRQSF